MVHIVSMGGGPTGVKRMTRKDRAKELPHGKPACAQTFSETLIATLQPILMTADSSL